MGKVISFYGDDERDGNEISDFRDLRLDALTEAFIYFRHIARDEANAAKSLAALLDAPVGTATVRVDDELATTILDIENIALEMLRFFDPEKYGDL